MNRYWRHLMVAAAIVEGPTGVLLVENDRSWQTGTEWSLPAGILDPDESLIDTAAREVYEETGLEITGWSGLAYVVHRIFAEKQLQLVVHVFAASAFTGDLVMADPDGIVVDARWTGASDLPLMMPGAAFYEPLLEWLDGPRRTRIYEYREIAGKPDELVSRVDLGEAI